jgi:hypothetical protein
MFLLLTFCALALLVTSLLLAIEHPLAISAFK